MVQQAGSGSKVLPRSGAGAYNRIRMGASRLGSPVFETS